MYKTVVSILKKIYCHENEFYNSKLKRFEHKIPKNITQSDQKMMQELLEIIAAADEKETPGKLEKRLASIKILKNSDKYKRYGILQTLAECGILPNKYISPKYEAFTTEKDLWKASEKLPTSDRSDIVLPLAGWKGENGVDFKRYNEIFQEVK